MAYDIIPNTWDDYQLLPNARPGGTAPSFLERANGVYMFQLGNNDELHGYMQMPHAWNKGLIDPHIHWEPAATGAHSFNMDLNWIWAPAAGAVTTTGSNTKAISGTQNAGTVYINGWDNIDLGAGAGASTLLLFRMKITSLTGGNIWLWGWDCHIQKNRSGTINEASEP